MFTTRLHLSPFYEQAPCEGFIWTSDFPQVWYLFDPFQAQLRRDTDQLAPKKQGAEKVLTAALHIMDPRSGKGPLAEHEGEEW